ATAAPAVKAAAASGGVEQVERSYEEVVVCRSSQRVIKGSAARRQKAEGAISGRVNGGGYDGRRDKWVGLLEGSNEALWTCGRGGGGGENGDDDTDDSARFLDLAINPSPWGAFVGGPPGMQKTPAARGGSGGSVQRQLSKKRPSSAPRQPPTATAPPTGRSEEGGGRTTRPRSAHAASPSRHNAAGTFVTAAYGGGGGGGGGENEENCISLGETPHDEETEKSNSARRGSRGGLSVPAGVVGTAGQTAQGTGGVAVPTPGGKVIFAGGGGGGCHPGGIVEDAELVVGARQLQPRTAFSPANKGSRYNNSGLEKKAGETPAPAFSSRTIASGMLFDTQPPPSLARPTMPRTPAPSPPPPLSPPAPPPPLNKIGHTLGLTGSAIVPGVPAAPAAAGGTEPRSCHGTTTRRVFQHRQQQQQQQQTATTLAGWVKEAGGRWRNGENGSGNATATATGRYGFSTIAPSVVLDPRTANNNPHGDSGRRRARASGLVGKALRVRRPKQLVLGR
ncbi:unnamed protein product, partial [Ectocarpus sp. 8 AP-2014]